MKLKRSYYNRGGVILGLSLIFCSALCENYTSFAKHFFAQFQKLSVADRRPIAAAIREFGRRHGAIITYEDVPYMNEMDIVDQTSPEWIQSHPNGARALIPKGGSLEISYLMSSVSGRLDEIHSVIQKLLDTHAEKNNPGRFRLQQEGGLFHVIPAQVMDRTGRLVPVVSILDTPISFPEQERSILVTLEHITNAVSQARGIKFVTTSGPLNVLERTRVRRGANNEKARDILISTLKATESKLSWQIFYDPGMKWYALNIRVTR